MWNWIFSILRLPLFYSLQDSEGMMYKVFDIREELKKLPDKPGVYIMHDSHDDIIYVGKAVVLKNRVRQYFRSSSNLSPKIRQMVSNVARFEYIVTDSEMEALVLENNLIKEYRPKYNTMLKDDKTYPYIKVTVDEEYPRMMLVRRVKRDRAKYYGPYTSAQSVRDTIDLARKIYKIRACSQKLPKEAGTGRPCLYYHLGQCEAPCQGYISQEKYGENVKELLRFLGGNFEPVLSMLSDKMYAASEKMDFENAAMYRDLLDSVRQIDQKQKINSSQTDDRDVIAFAREGDEAVVQVFFVRNGKLMGREHSFVSGVEEESDSSVITSFVKQYYASSPFVPSILMLQYPLEDADIILEWLSQRRGHKVREVVPVRGEKEKLVDMAAENARMVLVKDKERIKLEEARTVGAVKDLSDILGLPGGIRRIEAYDISDISGVEAVGSMVVYEMGKPKRNAYRKFRIRTVSGPDDYRCMNEVLTRRFVHGINEAAEAEKDPDENFIPDFSDFPDVIMIDGGRGQVNVALAVLNGLGLDIPVCGMVKDDRHNTRALFYEGKELSIDTHSEVFKLITRIQDEVHRFAIEYHRQRRSSAQIHSVLDEIPGIGPARRKALMRQFGGIEKIRTAEVSELAQVPSMNAASAKAVYDFFHVRPEPEHVE